jgi:epoxyqueuosine reductase
MKKSLFSKKFSRRSFLKATGAASAVVGSAGLGFFGHEAGKDPATYTGCESFQGAAQTFNRKKFEQDHPHYKKVGPTERVDARTGVIFYRFYSLMRQWKEETGLEGLDPVLKEYYSKNSEDLELDLYYRKELMPKLRSDSKKYKDTFILSQAWSNAMGAVSPSPIREAPEKSDFPSPSRYGEVQEPLKMKDPEKTAKLIKKIAYELGSVLVGITKLNPDWVYKYPMKGRGFEADKLLDVPKHWEYAIVIGTPMSWDPMYANPNFGTSNDAYSKSRIVAFRLASFIKQLGYAARPHTPGTSYDLMVPPIAIDAGLGELGRNGIVVTPELGCNFRPAVITTNIPMIPDKPIEFGVQKFCKTCKVCAENCPSGAIPKGEQVVVRGYLKYQLDISKCHNFWGSKLGNMGCRLCVSTCPYTRKSNWLHKTALNVTANDPTGISHKSLTFMQKLFYPGPDPQKYYMPSLGGENASFREPPWWLRSEDFIDF